MQLPLGLFGVVLGTVTLPLLSRLAARGEMQTFRSELSRGMRLAFLMTLPSTVGLMMLAEPIICVLYQHGRFGARETAQAAGALRYYAIGLAGYAALKVLANAFYAVDRRKTPMMVSFAAVGLNLVFNWIFTFRLGWGHRGLAFSTGCVASCNFLVLYFLMRRHLQGLEGARMLTLLGKACLACAALGAVCWAAAHGWLAQWATQSFWRNSTYLALTILIGGGVFVACGAALRIEELNDILAAMHRRLGRRPA
jgi:putative peptidoglycan lipid II flippase